MSRFYSISEDEFITSPAIPEEFTNILYSNVLGGSHVIIVCGNIVLPRVSILENIAL